MGFVKKAAFTGLYGMNLYNFEHFNLNYLSLNMVGKPVLIHHLQPHFFGGQYLDAFE